MEKEALINQFSEKWPEAVVLEGGEWLNMQIEPAQWKGIANWLRETEDLYFDYLFCVTCIDWLKHLTMVYHLTSTRHRHMLVVKANLDRDQPIIETVSNIWRTAEFHEREVYEMYGVHFTNHADLRKLILPDDWVGYPMRKDYHDPVNMIKL